MTNNETTLKTSLALFTLFHQIDKNFSLQYAICFHHIALNPGINVSALAKQTGIQLSTVSRIVGALSNWRQNGDGYGLVVLKTSEKERRKKELFLSDKGMALTANILRNIAA